MSPIPKNQAPNMYIESPTNHNYDMLMIDWRCDTDAANTFWNLHYYKLNSHPDGYSGFQNSLGTHRLIFSLWESGSDIPEIEYISPWTNTSRLLFSGEGTGKHILTTLNWEVGAWYTLCIGTKTMYGKTFIAQWVRKEGDTNWLLCGIMSFPVKNKYIRSSSFFMEDYRFNNYTKKCSLKNYFGRRIDNSAWHSRDQYIISNRYYPYKGESTHQDNVSIDCDFGIDSSGDPSLWIQAGGEDLINPTPHGFVLPTDPPISVEQDSTPIHTPQYPLLLPRYIQSKLSSLYISPGANDQVVQGDVAYHWVFEDSGDDYFYILSYDKSKAITVNSDGNTLTMEAFSESDAQKWTKYSYPQSINVYFVPKNYPSKSMMVSGGSTEVGGAIALSNFDDTSPEYQFYTQSNATFRTIKSYGNKYVAPSGNQLAQRALPYRWLFVPADDTFFYILTQDCLNAITVNGTYDGANLLFSPFVMSNAAQMWKLEETGNDSFYIIPKKATSKNMDVEGPSTSSGAFIQLWTHNTTSPQFKWVVEEV